MAKSLTTNSIPRDPEISILPDSIQCCSDVKETISRMVVVTSKMMKCSDKGAELVTGKEFITIHFPNSELAK